MRCRGSCRTITRSVLLERSALTAEPAPRTLKLVTSAAARRAVALRQAACVRVCLRAAAAARIGRIVRSLRPVHFDWPVAGCVRHSCTL